MIRYQVQWVLLPGDLPIVTVGGTEWRVHAIVHDGPVVNAGPGESDTDILRVHVHRISDGGLVVEQTFYRRELLLRDRDALLKGPQVPPPEEEGL